MSAKRRQSYEKAGVTVTFDSDLCVHAGECLRRLPNVFDRRVPRWIRPENASGSEVMDAVDRCPSGALHATSTDGATEVADQPVTIRITARGQIEVRGAVSVLDHERTAVRSDVRLTLCRCGQSGNKPFCDGSHRAVGFADPGTPLESAGRAP